jgi:HlyD family secretion protein
MMRRVYLWAGSLLVGCAIGYLVYEWLIGPRVYLEPVGEGTLVHTIVASGRVQSAHRINLGAQITGTVSKVLATEGQKVARGQLLLTLDSAELSASVAQARAAEQLAASNVRLVQEVKAPLAKQAWAQAEINVLSAQKAVVRAQALFVQGFYGGVSNEDAQRALEIAQSQFSIAQHQWTSVQPGGSESDSAQAAWVQAKAALQTQLARFRYSQILAPRAAVLMARNAEEGDAVVPGKVLMVLSPLGSTQLILQIDEKNLKWLQLGQRATAYADAFAERKFAAHVAFIHPAVDAQRGAIEVRLDVSEPVDLLKQDMTVSVDIEVARRPQAVLLAQTAIHDFDSEAPWALVVRGGKAVRQSLTLGLVGQGKVQVLAGLQAGEMVIPTAQTGVHEGGRIRQAQP